MCHHDVKSIMHLESQFIYTAFSDEVLKRLRNMLVFPASNPGSNLFNQ